jgi:hypothetical protein
MRTTLELLRQHTLRSKLADELFQKGAWRISLQKQKKPQEEQKGYSVATASPQGRRKESLQLVMFDYLSNGCSIRLLKFCA